MGETLRTLLESQLMHKLDRLRFQAGRAALRAARAGEHRSTLRGASVEFADYREYQPGDDYRYIDWNIYSRLDRLFIKLFVEERSLRVELLVDASRSMGFGDPAKLTYALRVAAGLGYIALHGGEQLAVAAVSSGQLKVLPSLGGREQLGRLLAGLEAVQPEGETGLSEALTRFASQRPQPALTVLVSDLLDPAGVEQGLHALAASGRQLVVIHLLAPEELAPVESGLVQWVDAETGERLVLTVDPFVLEAYQQALNEWADGLRRFCLRRRIAYFPVSTALPLEDLFLRHLRRGGLLR